MLERKNSTVFLASYIDACIARMPEHALYIRRLYARVNILENSCWEFLNLRGNPHRTNYGAFYGKDGPLGAHVYSYIFAGNKKPKKGLEVMHACDFKRCINPAHLSVGDHQENVDDTWAKGRGRTGKCYGDSNGARKKPECIARGERITIAKLDKKKVIDIRKLYDKGVSIAALSRKYEVVPNTIYMVVNRMTWRHVG